MSSSNRPGDGETVEAAAEITLPARPASAQETLDGAGPERVSTAGGSLGDEDTLAAGGAGATGETARRSGWSTTPLRRGDLVGRYLVVELLGRGGMGVVYRAYDPDLDRAIALKLVRVGAGGSASDQERARLLREAQAMARLSHPNVIAVHDVGVVQGSVFVAMEYVDGTTLEAWQAERARSWRQVVDVYVQAGRGLAAAHAAGLIHRDFKPDNVMLERGGSEEADEVGRVRVLDFGLARAVGQDEGGATDPSTQQLRTDQSISLDESLTVDGALMGTPAYMSPEQHVGARVDAASDQFSFCVALFEALYGQRPFAGDTLPSLAYAVTQGEIRAPAARHDVPRHVHAAIMKGLSSKAAERHPSMDALLAALSRDPRRRWRTWGLGLGAVVLVSGAVAVARSHSEEGAPCTGAQARVDPVWNESRRSELARAFEATGLPFAKDSGRQVAAVLDRELETWTQTHTRACRATRITGEHSLEMLDLRMGCLDRRLREVDALVDRLVQADGEVVARAIDAVEALEDAQACNDVVRLGTRMGPPTDPEERAAVDQQEKTLAELNALLRVGKYEAAGERVEAVAEEVLAVGYPPLSAELLLLQAKTQSSTGKTKPAVQTYERAFEQALIAADDLQAADASRELAWLVGYRLAEKKRSMPWLRIARALLRRAGGDAEREAIAWTTEGAILVAAGKYDQAIEAHGHAREHWEAHDPGHPELARVLDSMGAAEVQRGNPREAVKLHRRALEIKRAHYGAQHPEAAASLRELANALGHMEKFEEALAAQQEVLEIEIRARGESNERVATALDDIGRSLRNLDRLDEAVEHHRRALEIWKAVLGDPHPSLAVSIMNIGYTLNAAGKFEAALVEFERALATVEASVGAAHPYAVYAHNAAASALVDLERFDEALEHVDTVLAMKDLQVDPTLVAETKFIGSNALWPEAEAPPRTRTRTRAHTLALQAREAYAHDAERWGPYLEKIDTWLAERSAGR